MGNYWSLTIRLTLRSKLRHFLIEKQENLWVARQDKSLNMNAVGKQLRSCLFESSFEAPQVRAVKYETVLVRSWR